MNSIRLRPRRNRPRHGPLTAMVALFAVILCAQPLDVIATGEVRTVALGESNSEAQQQEVLAFLNATADDQMVTVSVAETFETMDGVFDLSGVDSAYSSTALTCQPEGSGIDVMTRNIEVIPPELYALALLTAGMSDVQLAVAAPTDAPALGMTAMTGIFKTWDITACSTSGGDLARRQLALEQLAMVAGIGEDLEAVRQTTLVVLDAQQKIVGQQVTTGEIDAIVDAESAEVGLDPGATDRATVVDFLSRLATANIDWGRFSNGWSTQYSEDGSGVVLTANLGQDTMVGVPPAPAGVGAATGPIAAAPVREIPVTPTPSPAPTATPRSALVLPPSTPAISDDVDPAVIGTVSEGGRDSVTRWWPLAALIVVGAPLLGFLARRRSSGKPVIAVMSLMRRRRTSGPGRTQVSMRSTRRPVATESSGHIRRVRISRDTARS